jgi:hypothetical protein
METVMSAGSKFSPEQPVAESASAQTRDKPAALRKQAVAKAATANKSGSQADSPAFAQGAYYRQGVLVPGGPPARAVYRGKNR